MAAVRPAYAEAAAQSASGDPVRLGGEPSAREQQLEFHAIAGVRLERMLQMLSEGSDLRYAIRVTVVATEVCRPIAFYFQDAAEGRLRRNCPVLCELSKPSTSPIVACEQYLSVLLLGKAPAARLVWQHKGNGDFAAWAQAEPEDRKQPHT